MRHTSGKWCVAMLGLSILGGSDNHLCSWMRLGFVQSLAAQHQLSPIQAQA